MMEKEENITTNEAAGVLGVTRQRVLQLIQDGRLKAEKFGNVYVIRRADLAHIEEKPMGRPPKAKAGATKEKESDRPKKGMSAGSKSAARRLKKTPEDTTAAQRNGNKGKNGASEA